MENNQNKNLVLIEDLGMLYHTESSKKKYRFGLYKCYCGVEFKTVIRNVKTGHTISCGCYNRQLIKETNTTHGLSRHRLHNVWSVMLDRCQNKNNKGYENYGGRGIKVCDRWKTDFVSFYNWAIDNGYKEGLSIDRINNDLGYSPDNCRWATKKVQSRNTRRIMITNKSGYRGVCWNKIYNKWVARVSVNKKRIHLGYFTDKIDAAKAYDKYVIDNNLEHTKNFT